MQLKYHEIIYQPEGCNGPRCNEPLHTIRAKNNTKPTTPKKGRKPEVTRPKKDIPHYEHEYEQALAMRMREMSLCARELRALKHPPRAVIDTMLGLCVLLGHSRGIRQGEDWGLVCRTLGRGGRGAVAVRVSGFDPTEVSPEDAKYARDLLRRLDQRTVSAACLAAGIFYKWVDLALTACPPNPLPHTCL